ncbi:hypothetical protein FGIG_01280 [Fasciola gigantica]|uniref:Uncharacterized protein n=1 Tax=Fasciola gigantica TaxID=46835 RepID=A0A504Z4R0_FASGI|nr:hypothetical protein FGIG_01280 [Fasciola gigantica]
MTLCKIELKFPVMCIIISCLFPVSHSLFESQIDRPIHWCEKLTKIKQIGRRSVSLDLARLKTALGDYESTHLSQSHRWFGAELQHNITVHYDVLLNGTRSIDGTEWTKLGANWTQSNQTLHQAQSDSGIVDKKQAGNRQYSDRTVHAMHNGFDAHQRSVSETSAVDSSYSRVDIWTVFQLLLGSFTLVVHFGWLSWNMMDFMSRDLSRTCTKLCPARKNDKGTPDNAAFYVNNRVYLRLQAHLSVIGILYAISVLGGKIVTYSGLSSAAMGVGSERSLRQSAYWTCDIARSLSLLMLTVYWLNVLLSCVLSTRYVHRLFCECATYELGWTKNHTETFLCYFHFGASWIYAILLHLCGLLFTHFPTHLSDKLPTDGLVESRLRVLSIDCQVRPPQVMQGLFRHSCHFSFSEYILALVLSCMGDIVPVLGVVPFAFYLTTLSRYSHAIPFGSTLVVSSSQRQSRKGLHFDTSHLSSHELLSPSRNNRWKLMYETKRGSRQDVFHMFTGFGTWTTVLGLIMLLVHSARISLHVHQLKFYAVECEHYPSSGQLNVIDLNMGLKKAEITTPQSRLENGRWLWLFRLDELIEVGLVCLVPFGFFRLTQSLKCWLGFISNLEKTQRETQSVTSATSNSLPLRSIVTANNDIFSYPTMMLSAYPVLPSEDTQHSQEYHPPPGASMMSAMEPCELLSLSQFTRTEFEQVSGKSTTHFEQSPTRPDLCAHLCGSFVPESEVTTATLICTNSKSSQVPISVQVVSLHTFCCQAGSGSEELGTSDKRVTIPVPYYTDSVTVPSNPIPSDNNNNSPTKSSVEEWVRADASVGVLLLPSEPEGLPRCSQ